MSKVDDAVKELRDATEKLGKDLPPLAERLKRATRESIDGALESARESRRTRSGTMEAVKMPEKPGEKPPALEGKGLTGKFDAIRQE